MNKIGQVLLAVLGYLVIAFCIGYLGWNLKQAIEMMNL